MGVYMRNKATGEIRDVEPESAEFKDLRQEVTSAGLPMWEQTNEAHAAAVQERAAYGELEPEDLGHEHQDELYEALRVNASGVEPEKNPHLALTPGEIEQGLTPAQKLKDLEQQFEQRIGRVAPVFEKAADTIAEERKQRPAKQPAKGQSARAGGSDDREGAPVVQAKDEEEAQSPKPSQAKAAPAAASGGQQS
jgi:hypothetical protein